MLRLLTLLLTTAVAVQSASAAAPTGLEDRTEVRERGARIHVEVTDGAADHALGLPAAESENRLKGLSVRATTLVGLNSGASLGKHRANRWVTTTGASDCCLASRAGGKVGSGLANQTRKQLLQSRTSLQKRVAEHRQKLADYKANPLAHDNKGLLKNAPTDAIRQKIISGRIKVLEGQIDKQLGELAKVNKLLGE